MKLDTLADAVGEWLRGTGPESDIVMSSRVRLARNVAQYPFVSRMSDQDRGDVERFLRERISSSSVGKQLDYIDVGRLEEIDRQFLVERQLISREHAEAQGARGVAIDGLEQVSLMINEEDHLRIQCMHSGLDLRGAWEQIRGVDDQIGSAVPYAYHPKWGYLTACPTNVGTGIRVSDYERRAREFLVRETQQNVHDQVSRAYGILRTAQTITAEETMQLLSRVRMGVLLGLIGDVKIADINSLLIRTQPAHLQKLRGVELDTKDRNIERARYLRRHFEGGPSGSPN